MVYIASDHRGFDLKNRLKQLLEREGYEVVDLGADELVPGDDYPDYVAKLAPAVQKDLKKNKGILLCGSGVGVCVAANKYKGIRAALVWDEEIARQSRNDDDANVLCLHADSLPPEAAEKIAVTFLNTPFSGADRHIRRLKKISEIE